MKAMVLAAVLVAMGCAHVRQEDVSAWSGVRRSELDSHPLFSVLPRSSTTLEDGRELVTYSNCGRSGVVCSQVGYTTICNGGGDVCCHNQFFIRGDTVESYRLVGRCMTDCSVRPESRPCSVKAPAPVARR